jgi:hypothetical protein
VHAAVKRENICTLAKKKKEKQACFPLKYISLFFNLLEFDCNQKSLLLGKEQHSSVIGVLYQCFTN